MAMLYGQATPGILIGNGYNGPIMFGIWGKVRVTIPAAGGLNVQQLAEDTSLGLYTYSDTVTHAPYLKFYKSHQDTVGNTETIDTDVIGALQWYGVDSGGNPDLGASIVVTQVDAAGTKVPTKMEFSTSTDTNTTVALKLDNAGSYGEVGIASVNCRASVMGYANNRLLTVFDEAPGGFSGATERRDVVAISNPSNAAAMTNTRTSLCFSQKAYDAVTPEWRESGRFVVGTEGNWTVADDNTIDSYMAFYTAKNKTLIEQVKINSEGAMFVEGAAKRVACGGGDTGAPGVAGMSITLEINGVLRTIPCIS
jgi:hypothetical protein